MLSDEEHSQLVNALRDWAVHAPDRPVVGFSEDLLTPQGLVEEVTRLTQTGRGLLGILEHGVRREGLAAVVGQLSKRTLWEFSDLVESVSRSLPGFAMGTERLEPGDVVGRHGASFVRFGQVDHLGIHRFATETRRVDALQLTHPETAVTSLPRRGETLVRMQTPGAWVLVATDVIVDELALNFAEISTRDGMEAGLTSPGSAIVTHVGHATRATLVAAVDGPASVVLRHHEGPGPADNVVVDGGGEVVFATGDHIVLTCVAWRLRTRRLVSSSAHERIEQGRWEIAPLPVEEGLAQLAERKRPPEELVRV